MLLTEGALDNVLTMKLGVICNCTIAAVDVCEDPLCVTYFHHSET